MNIKRLADSLYVIGFGMLGVFIAIGLIALSVIILSHIFKAKNKEE